MANVFQNFHIYPKYHDCIVRRLQKHSIEHFKSKIIEDRFLAMHMLKYVEDFSQGDFSIASSQIFQKIWAEEHGIKNTFDPEKVLLEQIEDSNAEVFYNLDPSGLNPALLRKLPGNIKKSVAWLAAPSSADLSAYDLVVCNFDRLLGRYRRMGLNAEYFFPAFDPIIKKYRKDERDIDIAFVGTYSHHHINRRELLIELANLNNLYDVNIHLQFSKPVIFANLFSSILPIGTKLGLPRNVLKIVKGPQFGLDLYKLLGRSKIVVNVGIDFTGKEKGNMRCWESIGAGAVLLTDEGVYPKGMTNNETIVTFRETRQLGKIVSDLIGDPRRLEVISSKGTQMIEELYSREKQWLRFQDIID